MSLSPSRKLLYVSSAQGVHDFRFIDLAKKAGWQVFFLRSDGKPNQKIKGACAVEWIGNKFGISEINQQIFSESFLEVEQSINPDLIQIGPLVPTAGALSENIRTPVLAVSWSRDLLIDINGSRWSSDVATKAITFSDHLLVDCQTVAQCAISLGAISEQISVIPWGVELETFKFRPRKSMQTDLKIISLRTLEPLYRVSDLIEAVRILKSRSSLNLKLGILGIGSDESNLREQVKSCQLGEYVVFLGHLPESELPSVLSKFDVYVSTSPVDGSSISMLQAMATGIPCVVPNIQSNREWVEDGLSGFLYEVGNSSELATILSKLSTKPLVVNSVIENARKVVEKRADWIKGGQSLLKVYERLASRL